MWVWESLFPTYSTLASLLFSRGLGIPRGFPGWSRGETGQADQVGKEVLGITQACVTWL